jgi:glycosyltransferase involved in cell wall biosynthesis
MLSLVIPVRNWPPDRLKACVRSFARLDSRTLDEIIVVDFGSRTPVRLSKVDRRVKVVRVEADVWSLGEANNIGVISARNPIVAKTDADIIVAQESGPGLDRIVRALDGGDLSLALGRTFDLPPYRDADSALQAASAELQVEGKRRPRWTQGTLCIFTIDAWSEIGGFDSRYTGWGSEDNDFVDRIRNSGRKVRWIDPDEIRVFHVWHEPSYLSSEAQTATEKNREIYASDKSVYRPLRLKGRQLPSLAKPILQLASRPLVTICVG